MNIEYLNTLPEVSNKFQVELEENEKVVFCAKLSTFGTETGAMLGGDDSKFTLTNKRIIADNGLGIWRIDIKDDLVSCNKVEDKFIIFKMSYFLAKINKEIIYDDGRQKLNGFQFYFKRSDAKKFEQIMKNLFG